MPPTPHTHTDQTRSAEYSFLNTTGLKQYSKTIDINDFLGVLDVVISSNVNASECHTKDGPVLKSSVCSCVSFFPSPVCSYTPHMLNAADTKSVSAHCYRPCRKIISISKLTECVYGFVDLYLDWAVGVSLDHVISALFDFGLHGKLFFQCSESTCQRWCDLFPLTWLCWLVVFFLRTTYIKINT